METDYIDYNDLMHDASRALEREQERIAAEAEQVNAMQRVMEAAGELISKNERLASELEDQKAEAETLRERLQEEKEQRLKLEMQLNEMSKLSAGVAKKASQDELLKALRTYINISKRKTLSKRSAVKVMIMELASAVGLVFPDDVAATLESLDDEQAEAKVVNNNFEAGSTAQVFNGPTTGVFKE